MTTSPVLPSIERDEPLDDAAQAKAHGIEMLRNARRLRDVAAVRVEDRSGVIQHFAHDGRAAGAPDGDVHFGGGGGQRVLHDLEFDRVQFDHGFALRFASRWPCRATNGGPAVTDQDRCIILFDDGRPQDAFSGQERCRAAAPQAHTICRRCRRVFCRVPRQLPKADLPPPRSPREGRWL